jgi:hypothetical protein
MTTGVSAGNPLGAMALACLVLLSGMFLAPRLFRQVKRGGDRTADRVNAAAESRRMMPGAGMGANQAGGHLGAMAMIAAAGTLNSSPVSEWLLGGVGRPLSPYSRRLMRSSLNSAEYQRRMAMDRNSYQWALERRLNLRGVNITDPYGVANAADTMRDMGIPEAQLSGALLSAGANQDHVNLVLRARADLFADTYTQRNLNVPVQRYLAAMRHVEGKQRVSDEEFRGYLGVATVVASNLFSKTERPLYEIAPGGLPPRAPVIARFAPYLTPGSPQYSPFVDMMVNNSEDRMALRAALAAPGGLDLVFSASPDERNAVAAYWSREAQTTARALAGAPNSVTARDDVARARESIRNIEMELGPRYASPFSP